MLAKLHNIISTIKHSGQQNQPDQHTIPNAPHLMINEMCLRYKEEQNIIADLNMYIPAAQWTCILGRSGCGKSTLLRYLASLLSQKVQFTGEIEISNQQPLRHQVAYMAQQDLLMPWLSVLDNVLLSEKFDQSKSNKQNSRLQIQKAKDLLVQVGLADKAQERPQKLSGGMRQRVALARTLMQDKPVVLMDEPFSALDAVTRYRLQNLAHQLLKDKTVVLITHDPQEAIRLANQLYIMQGKPASATSLSVPDSVTPRAFDTQSATLQQLILDKLEQDDE
jgi:putative hydroxymethylpyrimidine transport system ATP-binding protein